MIAEAFVGMVSQLLVRAFLLGVVVAGLIFAGYSLLTNPAKKKPKITKTINYYNNNTIDTIYYE